MNDPFEKHVDLYTTKDNWFCETQMCIFFFFFFDKPKRNKRQVANFCTFMQPGDKESKTSFHFQTEGSEKKCVRVKRSVYMRERERSS